jgi:hypothetical protein
MDLGRISIRDNLIVTPLFPKQTLLYSFSHIPSQSKAFDVAAPNASMCPTSNGSGGLELEKFPDAPPTIAVTAPEDVPDAGLRSLDHCKPSKTQLSTEFAYAHLLAVAKMERGIWC